MRGLMYQTSGQSQGSRRYIEAIPQRVSPRLTVYVIGALGLICGADDGAAEAEASGWVSADAIAASVAVWLSPAACAWGAGGAVSSAALGAVWRGPCSNEQPASVTDRARPAAKRARKTKFETILHPRISAPSRHPAALLGPSWASALGRLLTCFRTLRPAATSLNGQVIIARRYRAQG